MVWKASSLGDDKSGHLYHVNCASLFVGPHNMDQN